ncbi:MAG: hypothetical protein R3345_01875 [Fulvivirga sp.]|nr:hypothetical protein [Fulvivirga sp.]
MRILDDHMKTNTYIGLFFFLSSMLWIGAPLMAQEEGFSFPREENDDNRIERSGSNTVVTGEGLNIHPVEKESSKRSDVKNKSQKENNSSKKTANQNQANSNTSEKKSNNESTTKEKDDSVLSFNFLYYMIQKFKFSDVVDD